MQIWELQENLKESVFTALHNISKIYTRREEVRPFQVELEAPKMSAHGDLSTNAAMRLSKKFSQNPLEFANLLKGELLGVLERRRINVFFEKIEVLPPGFINFYFSRKFLHSALTEVRRKNHNFGRSNHGRNKKINIEFVSANPTGPLTVAHGRQAALGDALSRILRFCGYRVWREYFINDVGTQIELLGKSIYSRYLSLCGSPTEVPNDGYHGEYIKVIAERVKKFYGDYFIGKSPAYIKLIARYGVNSIMKTIKDDLNRFGVAFDRFYSQSALSSKAINAAIKKLELKGHIYRKDGATWFKSTALGDDKDRVCIKSDGSCTYLAPDIAYHLDKYKRGFNKLINLWGPDHHGYIPRLIAAIKALGYEEESISILIVQLATLYRNGVAISMSTRKGEFITLKEIMDEVGADAARFFFLMRKTTSHLDFDLELAKKNSLDNPVYYIQYAHARIWSILGYSKILRPSFCLQKVNLDLLEKNEEILLARTLCQFPLAAAASAQTLEPYRIVEYLEELAKIFHNFYAKHRVVSEDKPLTRARLFLVECVRVVLANGLGLLGVSLPKKM